MKMSTLCMFLNNIKYQITYTTHRKFEMKMSTLCVFGRLEKVAKGRGNDLKREEKVDWPSFTWEKESFTPKRFLSHVVLSAGWTLSFYSRKEKWFPGHSDLFWARVNKRKGQWSDLFRTPLHPGLPLPSCHCYSQSFPADFALRSQNNHLWIPFDVGIEIAHVKWRWCSFGRWADLDTIETFF